MSQQPAPVAVAVASNRIWTVPNLISFVRLLGVPLFLYLLLVPHEDVAAVVVLAVGGSTDWVDGYVARRTNTVSRLGELLDPFADRLYILATLIGFTVRGVVPWWLTIALLLREAVLGVALLVLRRYGYGPPAVHYVGKTGTFVLLVAFPVILLARAVPSIQPVAGPIGWGLAWWALGLYWAAAVLYLAQTRQVLRADKAIRAREMRSGVVSDRAARDVSARSGATGGGAAGIDATGIDPAHDDASQGGAAGSGAPQRGPAGSGAPHSRAAGSGAPHSDAAGNGALRGGAAKPGEVGAGATEEGQGRGGAAGRAGDGGAGGGGAGTGGG